MYFDTILLGRTLSLFLANPNWKSAVKITPRFSVEVLEATSTREDRYPRQEFLRHDVEATFFLGKETHDSLQREVALPRADFVAIPLFVDRLLPADWSERIWDSQYVINYDESGYTIYPSVAVPNVLARKWLAPLLVGRLKERPKLKLFTDESAMFTLRITERSPWEFRLKPVNAAVGANFPETLRANWTEFPEDSTEDRIEYFDVGDGRTEAVSGTESAPRRAQRGLFSLKSRAEIRTLLNFFLARKGQLQSFTVPWLARPSNDTPETPHHVKVRFAEPELTLEFVTDEFAHVRIGFVEVPWEKDPVAGETPAQPAPAYLYRFSYKTPGGALYSRFTSWERPLQRTEFGATVTYVSDFGFAHDHIAIDTDLSDVSSTIESHIFDGNPLMKLLQRRLDVPLLVEILKCDPTNPEVAELRYLGEIRKPRANGLKIAAPTLVLGGVLETKVPNFYRGPKCNHQFCGVGCGLNMDNIRIEGIAETQVGKQVTIRVTSNPANIDLSADFLATGALELGDLEYFQSRHVVRSAPAVMDGGQTRVTLTLKRELLDFIPGSTVKIFPECAGTKSECQSRWNNYINHGGHPHIGDRNLSLPQREIAAPTGKK